MRYLLLSFLLFCASASFAAEIGYRYVHPDGTVEFSDKPIPGGEEIKLRGAPAIKFAPVSPSPATKSTGQKRGSIADSQDAEGDGTVTITSPQPDQTLRFDESGITVAVSVSLGLQSGEQISISLDGKVVATGSGSSFNINEVYRGSHTLIASVVSASGITLFISPPVTFHVRQHSVIDRQVPIEE